MSSGMNRNYGKMYLVCDGNLAMVDCLEGGRQALRIKEVLKPRSLVQARLLSIMTQDFKISFKGTCYLLG